ncbi:MAG: FKBP-type peptidyl-prolyl cis-trans isomerase [Candidatus Saccharibacteria bacterium]|nr:FKBP-type peptidyl-prolyl cis-trans isomerase [Candidatus Saccharibacteria bacterium]
MTYEGTKLTDFTPIKKIEELKVIDIMVGSGPEVQPGATITAHYTGALCKNGVIFQSSHDFGKSVTIGLDQVIEGWTKGVPGMKVGGMRRLIIPSAMAYGSVRAASNIPPNSDLVFDIELINIK